ncbi:hypothetical protein [Marinobacter sp. JSM 1782161]|uniref:hypothetical protein n=1 Tax=Marinobacter sp. JSM 1782161 TaxID=2685906 RepID=UPI001403FDF9|nr:hypothetical protein [Marinobacter sp. JSM 1782161]
MPLSPLVYRVLVALVVLAATGLALLLGQVRVADANLGPYDHYRCDTGAEQGGRDFRILTTTNYLAPALADHLCQSGWLADRFGGVDISWQPRALLDTRDLADQRYDLLWNRHRVLRGLLANVDQYYERLLQTPTYSVYWLSRTDKPQLTADYFADKRVGLIQDSQSQSSFQQPVGQLRQAGIELAPEQLHFFADRRSLYQAFNTGDVDIISGLKWVGEQAVPPERRLVIAEGLSTGAWFASRRVLEPGARCDLLAALAVMAPIYRRIHPGFRVQDPECVL